MEPGRLTARFMEIRSGLVLDMSKFMTIKLHFPTSMESDDKIQSFATFTRTYMRALRFKSDNFTSWAHPNTDRTWLGNIVDDKGPFMSYEVPS